MMRITRSKPTEPELFDCLSAEYRRATLAVLLSGPDGLSLETLAERVVARGGDGSDGDVSDAERQRATVSLHHKHLPKLAEAGLVDRDEERDRIAVGDHPALDDPGLQEVLDHESSVEALDEAFDAMANRRRQHALSVLAELHHPIDLREMAVLVAAREAESSPRNVEEAAVDRVHESLKHVHLPKLRAADFVERDGDGWTIRDDRESDVPTEGFAADFGRGGAGA